MLLDGPGRNTVPGRLGIPVHIGSSTRRFSSYGVRAAGVSPTPLRKRPRAANRYDPNARHKFVRRALTYFTVILYFVTEPRR
jgi:hypothetical protein